MSVLLVQVLSTHGHHRLFGMQQNEFDVIDRLTWTSQNDNRGRGRQNIQGQKREGSVRKSY
jgi:hypothetical protein